ncbi:MAG TPA: hypothetical protein DCO70_10655 [Verrucomicrobiales bacterium]|nr:hypothetical protein [Verrucomicrobiales bacterium]
MATKVTVPRMGWSMEEGTFQEWLKRDGERVDVGDMLFILEGDKASQEVESFDAGYLRLPPDAPKPGDNVIVGQRLAFLADENDLEPWKDTPKHSTAHTPRPPDGKATGDAKSQTEPQRHGKNISPRAIRLASQLGIDWNVIKGTGRGGRIREQDIHAAVTVGKALGPNKLLTGKTEPLSATRKVIARQMTIGTNLTAPVTLHREVDATALVELRRKHKRTSAEKKVIPSYNDMLIRLTAESLKSNSRLNCQWHENGIFMPDQIHIAFAIDTPAGLLTPVIRNANRLALDELAEQTTALIEEARMGQLKPEEMQGATFTISNLGGLGVDAFTPVINPPQCAVLGIGRIQEKVIWQKEQAMSQERLTLNLTFDHRIVDGAPAARFLEHLALQIENPSEWLMH